MTLLPALPDGIIRTPEGIHVLANDTHLSRWIELHKRLDIAEGEIAKWAKYIPVGGVVVDAGASLGDHTCTYAKLVGPTGRVVAFEPNPLAFQALALNFALWQSVIPCNAALSDREGRARMKLNENAGASHVETDVDGAVEVTTLDKIFNLERLDFMHFDLEGMEREALLGTRYVLMQYRPAIVLEINHGCLSRRGLNEHDVLATLGELGYTWQETEAGHGPHLPQRDLLCLPK